MDQHFVRLVQRNHLPKPTTVRNPSARMNGVLHGRLFSLEAAVIDRQNVLEMLTRQSLLFKAFVYRLHREEVKPLPSLITLWSLLFDFQPRAFAGIFLTLQSILFARALTFRPAGGSPFPGQNGSRSLFAKSGLSPNEKFSNFRQSMGIKPLSYFGG
jgi:hypothetical protein